MTPNKWVGVLLGFLLVVGIGATIWSRSPSITSPMGGICTQDAKRCPDGSYVSRIAPSCAFAACPSAIPLASSTPPVQTQVPVASSTQANWKVVTDLAQGVSYVYPEKLPTTYITAQVWPPIVTIERGALSCATEPRIVDGRVYCAREVHEGAAGSTYTEYLYTSSRDTENKLVSVKFTLRFVQCLNYDEPKQSACLQERSAFNPNTLADSILTTVRFRPDTPSTDVRVSPVTLDGEYTCLPHRGSGPHTMECAFGMKAANTTDTYYALDTQFLNADTLMKIETGTRIRVVGTLTPIEMLSSDRWKSYDIKGIMSATSLVVVK
jgi:hypothetical protein